MKKELLQTLQYFSFFNYAPTEDELWAFLKKEVTKEMLKRALSVQLKSKMVKSLSDKTTRYTVGEYSIVPGMQTRRERISREKIRKVNKYVKIGSFFPQVVLIGLSGSVAMMNADKNDDIDLFIVARNRRIWTARFLAIILAKLFRIHRDYSARHVGDKVCLNLFFDESNLNVPKRKKNEYVAHEILQMKPLRAKNDVYLRYLDANRWVFDLFPNAKNVVLRGTKPVSNYARKRPYFLSIFGDIIELLLKKLQLVLINKRRTTEIITDTQLWFFPDDFEKKISSRSIPARRKQII